MNKKFWAFTIVGVIFALVGAFIAIAVYKPELLGGGFSELDDFDDFED